MNDAEKTTRLAQMMEESRNICVFTGAGVSVASGIPDFRSANGLYSQKGREGYTPEQIISHSFFVKNPEVFYAFYKEKMVYQNAEPNAFHRFFAKLEQQGKQVPVVTQNIDGLHSAAGSTRVYELHGSIHRNFCTKCGAFYPLEEMLRQTGVPHCAKDGGILKPDVVLYEESLNSDTIENALAAISAAELLIVAGTSLTVYPAASFLQYFHGNNIVLMNKFATPMDGAADLTFSCGAEEVAQTLGAHFGIAL